MIVPISDGYIFIKDDSHLLPFVTDFVLLPLISIFISVYFSFRNSTTNTGLGVRFSDRATCLACTVYYPQHYKQNKTKLQYNLIVEIQKIFLKIQKNEKTKQNLACLPTTRDDWLILRFCYISFYAFYNARMQTHSNSFKFFEVISNGQIYHLNFTPTLSVSANLH